MIATARRFAFALALVLCVSLGIGPAVAPMAAVAATPFNDAKYAAIVIDATTGEVLYAKRADSARYPASITKIMTLYLTFEALSKGQIKPTDYVTVSPRAAAQAPSKLGLAAGQGLTVDEAIRAIAIKSANDIAVAMSEKIGGTESRFAALMTLKAQELGMSNTRFVNASGLPDSRQLTTARDIAILSRAVMRDYPQYYAYFSQQTWNWHGQTLRNHNGLLFRMQGVDGIKTGFTNASGYNLAASAVRDGRRLITVVMGGSSTRGRDNHVANLLEIGFDVLKRRERGELITVAQNYFEEKTQDNVPSAPVAYASLGPTSTPSAGDVSDALSSVVRPKTPARIVGAKPKTKAEPPRKEDLGAYTVQVGSFRSKADAKEWLGQAGKRFAPLKAGEPAVLGAGKRYRSVYTGMTKAEAEAACKAMKAKRLACMVTGGGKATAEKASAPAKKGGKAAIAKSGKKGSVTAKKGAKPAAKAKGKSKSKRR